MGHLIFLSDPWQNTVALLTRIGRCAMTYAPPVPQRSEFVAMSPFGAVLHFRQPSWRRRGSRRGVVSDTTKLLQTLRGTTFPIKLEAVPHVRRSRRGTSAFSRPTLLCSLRFRFPRTGRPSFRFPRTGRPRNGRIFAVERILVEHIRNVFLPRVRHHGHGPDPLGHRANIWQRERRKLPSPRSHGTVSRVCPCILVPVRVGVCGIGSCMRSFTTDIL